MDDAIVWDGRGQIVKGAEAWVTWDDVIANKGFPGGLIKFLQTTTDSQGCGFETPTKIQAFAWPVLMRDRDLVGIAKTGSGKTLAFLLPGFVKIRKMKKQGVVDSAKGPILLAITPTRELANQIWEDTKKFGMPVKITAALAYGGADRQQQMDALAAGPDCLIATPGRLNDLCDKEQCNLDQVRYAVIDEADRMLDMGFESQLRSVLDRVTPQRQTCMFTATWPKSVADVAKKYTKGDKHQVQIGNDDIATNRNISQHFEICKNDKEKEEAVKRILGDLGEQGNALIFCNTKKKCKELKNNFNWYSDLNLATEELHGDVAQRDRDEALRKFRLAETRVLVATDVASRGLDIRNVTKVILFDAPKCMEDYVHRIGRTGRACDSGDAYTLLNSWGDESNAQFIIEVLKKVDQPVPEALQSLAGDGSNTDWKKADWSKDDWKGKDSSKDPSWSGSDWKKDSENSNKRAAEGEHPEASPTKANKTDADDVETAIADGNGDKLGVAVLKAWLTERGLPNAGLKKGLLERVKQAVAKLDAVPQSPQEDAPVESQEEQEVEAAVAADASASATADAEMEPEPEVSATAEGEGTEAAPVQEAEAAGAADAPAAATADVEMEPEVSAMAKGEDAKGEGTEAAAVQEAEAARMKPDAEAAGAADAKMEPEVSATAEGEGTEAAKSD